MKNKEIEELLNDLKNTADTSFFAVCSSKENLEKMPRGVCKFLSLNDKQAKLLISHIKQLENNRDKAIEIIDLITPELWNISNVMTYKLKDIKYILKGDSDE